MFQDEIVVVSGMVRGHQNAICCRQIFLMGDVAGFTSLDILPKAVKKLNNFLVAKGRGHSARLHYDLFAMRRVRLMVPNMRFFCILMTCFW